MVWADDGAGLAWSLAWPGSPAGAYALVGAAAMLAAAMQAPPAGLALVLELTHSGFQLMIPMAAATVTATVVARHVDGYSIYTARLRAHPGPAEAAARRRPGAGRERARWVTAFRERAGRRRATGPEGPSFGKKAA